MTRPRDQIELYLVVVVSFYPQHLVVVHPTQFLCNLHILDLVAVIAVRHYMLWYLVAPLSRPFLSVLSRRSVLLPGSCVACHLAPFSRPCAVLRPEPHAHVRSPHFAAKPWISVHTAQKLLLKYYQYLCIFF